MALRIGLVLVEGRRRTGYAGRVGRSRSVWVVVMEGGVNRGNMNRCGRQGGEFVRGGM